MSRSILAGVILTFLMVGSLAVTTNASATNPDYIIRSHWTYVAPNIDGQFPSSEAWNTPQLELKPPQFPIHAFVSITNNLENLCVLVDAANLDGGDYSEDPEDHCSIILHNPIDDTIINVTVFGRGGSYPPGIEAMAGFGPSPNSPMNHRIYEFQVSSGVITITTTGASWVHFASPPTTLDSLPYDKNGPRINTWPPGAVEGNYDTYGIIILASPTAVGGYLVPVDKPASLSPYMVLAGLVGIVVVVSAVAIKKKRKN